jgi:hypothetical protein
VRDVRDPDRHDYSVKVKCPQIWLIVFVPMAARVAGKMNKSSGKLGIGFFPADVLLARLCGAPVGITRDAEFEISDSVVVEIKVQPSPVSPELHIRRCVNDLRLRRLRQCQHSHSNLADWLYAGFALVAIEFLLEVFFGLCRSMG